MDHDHDQGMGMASDVHSNNRIHAMQMTFYSGTDLTLLFSGWETTNGVQYGFTLLAVFFFALLHQFLSYLVHAAPTEEESLSKHGGTTSTTRWLLQLLLGLVSYAAYTSTSFLLMLMAMSFNVGVFLVIVAGLSFGILLFPKKRERKSLLVESASPQSGV